MYIKQINKKFNGNNRVYVQHRLVESYRTESGPRHRTILNLGTLDIPKEKFKPLADRIESLIFGRESLFPKDKTIESLAVHYAELIIKNKLIATSKTQQNKPIEETEQKKEFEEVDINTLKNSQVKTIGAEFVGIEIFRKLGIDKKLSELGFTKTEINLSALSIVGRLVNPQSERATRQWARTTSGIDELLGEDYSTLSNNALYRIADKLVEKKVALEEYLAGKERDLFSLEEKIILYDLTNTHFEGRAKKITRAKRGRSKQKRNDCPLVTLGLVIDEKGFPKKSEIFDGNVSEQKTLFEMLDKLGGTNNTGNKKTVVIDAGIATENNLALLKDKGYDYICVARNTPASQSETEGEEGLVTVKEDSANKVSIKMIRRQGESILYCKSSLRAEKEKSMQTLLQERIEKDLSNITLSLTKKGGTKQYDKVQQRIGRLKQKHSMIARYYTIEVKQKDDNAESITWKFAHKEKAAKDFDGSYFIRTSRSDLDEKTIWSIYTMLTRVEDCFRCLKSELHLRPVWHSKQLRADSHLFITVLAYHLLISIQNILTEKKIQMRWNNIRNQLSTQVRITTSLMKKDGQRILIRNTSVANEFNRTIYNALGMKGKPLRAIRIS